MKNFIFILGILLAIVASSNMGFAQTDNIAKSEINSLEGSSRMVRNIPSGCSGWGTFTNFTATDMNGVTHDIQSYLNQGKYVVIDFFCAWCSHCWNYYQRGTLEELYDTYGDGGTGEFVVLMVENELTNTEAQLTGTTTDETHEGLSQGDFTSDGTNPIPIIDATEDLVVNVSLYEEYYPAVYLFCPSGYVYEIYNRINTVDDIYNFATRNCLSETSLPLVEINISDYIYAGQTVTFSACVASISDATYAWTFEGGTPETSTEELVNVTWNNEGRHNVSLVVANENGSITKTRVVNVYDCSAGISVFPFVEDFEYGPGCWTLESEDTTNEVIIGEYSTGMNGLIFSSYNEANNYNQYFISPELHHETALKLSFKYKMDNEGSTGENFYVKYSTTTSDISSFITLGSMITSNSLEWEIYTGTLPSDAKYFMINYNTDYQFRLHIDDLTIKRAPIWSCDFEGDETWTFGNDQQAGNVQWQIVTPETYPASLISNNGAYFKPFTYEGDTLCDTPWHWAIVDLISESEQMGGTGQVAESPWIEFSGIDLRNAVHPQLVFNQIYRRLNSVETLVRVSIDGGQTWTDHVVNEKVESNKHGLYTISKGVSISEAVGQENVKIRFQMNGDGTTLQGYGWQIDDIEIIEMTQCDLTLQDARISMFGYIDYRNIPDDFQPEITDPDQRKEFAYHYYDPYAQSPREQWATESGYAAFNVEFSSYGYDTVIPTARVKITNPNGVEIYNKVASGTHPLSINDGDTADFFNSASFYFEGFDSYMDIITGRYTVDFYVFADDMDDADESDNHTTQYFDITYNKFSMSYDEPTGYYYYYTYSEDQDGIIFTYGYHPEDTITVDVYIDEHTTVGTKAQVVIYEYSEGVPVEVATSDTLAITSDMLGSWVNFPINDYANSDSTFMVAIRGIRGEGENLALGSSDVLTSKGHKSYMHMYDSWYYGSQQLAIRLRELREYNIEVLTSNQEYGYVTGSGTYEDGTEVIITANPYQGYKFFLWDDGDRENVFERYNNESSRTITVTSDKTYTATFVRDEGVEKENILVELFAYRGCGYSPYAAKALDNMEDTDSLNIIVLDHHISDAYQYTESTNRFYYWAERSNIFGEIYGFDGTPSAVFDGFIGMAGASITEESAMLDAYTTYYNNVKTIKSLYSLNAEFEQTEPESRTFALNVTAEKHSEYFGDDQIVVMAALTEDIDYDWGVAGKINNLVRVMYPDANGTEATFDENNRFSTNFTINVSNEYDISKCKVVVWVENHTQGRVMQSKRFNVMDFYNLEAQQYTITVIPNNAAYGSVSGGGTYEEGTDVIIMAMPNGGYLFDSWEDDNAENPRTITVTSDSTFVADFVKCEITQTIDTVVPNFVTVGDHTFYSTGNYSFAVLHETDCDTIFDINLTVLAEPVYDIGPNPTKSLLNINSDGFISAVEFYSVTGQLVMRKEVNGYEAEFDMEGLVDGVYILRIYGEESSLPAVSKVVKE